MEPICQLYLVSPPALNADFEAALDAALGAGEVTAFLLRLPGADKSSLLRAIERLRLRVLSAGHGLPSGGRSGPGGTFPLRWRASVRSRPPP